MREQRERRRAAKSLMAKSATPMLRLVLRVCCGFVAGSTSISSRIYRDVADVAGPRGGKGHPPLSAPSLGRSWSLLTEDFTEPGQNGVRSKRGQNKVFPSRHLFAIHSLRR